MATSTQGNLTALGDILAIAISDLHGAALALTGTFALTVSFEGTIDGKNYFAVKGVPAAGGVPVTSATAAGNWQFDTAGLAAIRARVSAWTSGTAHVAARAGGSLSGSPALIAAMGALGTAGSPSTDVGSVQGVEGGTPVSTVIPVLTPSASFVRPTDTTAYALGDLVANNTSNASVVPMSFTAARVAAGSGMIRRAKITLSSKSVTLSSFRLHLYTASPTIANGDNAAWSTTLASYIGSIDITVDKVGSDVSVGHGIPQIGSEMQFVLASGTTVYGLLEARAAYAPGNGETITVGLEVLPN